MGGGGAGGLEEAAATWMAGAAGDGTGALPFSGSGGCWGMGCLPWEYRSRIWWQMSGGERRDITGHYRFRDVNLKGMKKVA